MKLLSFKGGTHPLERKELSSDAHIKRVEPPEIVYLPLSQHTGAPSKVIIEKKDEVTVGMKIAEGDGKISVPLHSSVAGVFMGVVDYPHPLGEKKPAMKIKVDHEKTGEWEGKERDPESLSPEEIIKIVRESGIVGMGGAAFPTHFKLQPPPDKPIADLIINGAECEPFLTSDYRLMMERTEDILKGVDIIRRVLNPERIWISIESNKMDAVEKMKEAASTYPWAKITVHATKYPQGSEKQLVQSITGLEVPDGGLPFDVGAYVQNVGTAVAIYEAVRYSKPLYERIVTVTGSVREPSNFLVPIGTPFEYLIEQASGVIGELKKIINGGPMMGIAQVTGEVPVIKGTTGILIQNEEEIIPGQTSACIRCASCIDICPLNLMSTELYKFISMDNFDRAEELGLLSCIECGTCSYVCPSNIPLTQYFKYGKAMIAKRRK
ncbi:electron transport complex subunit RsxC [candidate division WOR-3 bacterium]|nr:electron transport complex subunit RsxC [candidate division WOR-3 bacterium]